MIKYTTGNLLDSDAEALVNTVNTVGVMGKGIALMFKEAFPKNTALYEEACKNNNLRVGHIFATRTESMIGPKFIVNFPTKQHWRHPSKLNWITDGLFDLRRFLIEEGVRSIAIPPLGAGNGGLDWADVKDEISRILGDLEDVEIIVFEPTRQYQNVAKREGKQGLTPARAIMAEIIRRYWILGIECTLLEAQKLAWFIHQSALDLKLRDPLGLSFSANKYGPYSDQLRHLLNAIDGSYLHCEKRVADAQPLDVIWFAEEKRDVVSTYLRSEAKEYLPALDAATKLIDGYESPYGMELLATVDWVLREGNVEPTVEAVADAIRKWPHSKDAANRKARLFNHRHIELALDHLASV